MDRRPDFSKDNARTNLELAFIAGAALTWLAMAIGWCLSFIK